MPPAARSMSGMSAQHRRVRVEGNAWGHVACAIGVGSPVRPVGCTGSGWRQIAARAHLVRAPAVRHRAHPGRAAARGRRARVPVAGLVQRLVRVPGEHGPLQPGPDPRVRVLGLPQDPGALSQLRPHNDSATSYGPRGRRDGLRAGQAPFRRPGLAGHAGRRAGALRRVRDPARAPDPVRRAVPVRAHAGHHAAAVGSRRGRPPGAARSSACCWASGSCCARSASRCSRCSSST